MFSIIAKKRCRKCGIEQPVSNFSRDKKSRDGLQTWCKKCHGSEDVLEKVRNWISRNPERQNKSISAWRVENLDRWKGKEKLWRKGNSEKLRIKSGNRRARVHGNGGVIAEEEWQALKAYHNFTCLRCKRREPEIKLTLDHVKPIDLGGVNLISNSQPLCLSCNSWKRNKHIDYRK